MGVRAMTAADLSKWAVALIFGAAAIMTALFTLPIFAECNILTRVHDPAQDTSLCQAQTILGILSWLTAAVGFLLAAVAVKRALSPSDM